MKVTGWKLWYADGSTATKSWRKAAQHGVQVMMVYHPGGYRTSYSGQDTYRLHWWLPVKYGSTIDEARYEAILAEAMEDSWRPPTS